MPSASHQTISSTMLFGERRRCTLPVADCEQNAQWNGQPRLDSMIPTGVRLVTSDE